MTIVLKRKINYHLLQTYLPSGTITLNAASLSTVLLTCSQYLINALFSTGLFVIVSWLSLFLPPESIPGRTGMAMTTLLTLAAMFGAVRQNTPKVSYVSALDVWMCSCIIFVFFILLEYVIILRLVLIILLTNNEICWESEDGLEIKYFSRYFY